MDASLWQARATLWEFLAFSFCYPEENLLSAINSGEWEDTAQELRAAFALSMPEDWNDNALGVNASDLRADATRLFIGVESPECPAHEGLRRARAEKVEALYFINPHSVEVKHFFKSCGLQGLQDKNEPLDFISTECELLEYLSLVSAGAVDPVAGVVFPGGSAEAAYKLFLEEHVLAWVPEFAASLEKSAHTTYYRRCAQFLQIVMEWATAEVS